MADVLHGSVLFRALDALHGWLGRQVSESCILSYLAMLWRGCFLRKLFVSGGDRMLRQSALYASAERRNERLAQAHGLGACVRDSLLYRIPAAICRAGKSSFFLGRLFSSGGTGILLTLLGLYAGLDWLLRDLFSVPVLSSLWPASCGSSGSGRIAARPCCRTSTRWIFRWRFSR